MKTEELIEHFILERQLSGSGKKKIAPDESLISSGILDSMSLLQLVTFIEEQFGVTVGDGELIPDNFETINSIKTFLNKKTESK